MPAPFPVRLGWGKCFKPCSMLASAYKIAYPALFSIMIFFDVFLFCFSSEEAFEVSKMFQPFLTFKIVWGSGISKRQK